MKFIFLDIDGVLITHSSLKATFQQCRERNEELNFYIYDAACVQQFNRITDSVDMENTRIVISSTHRKFNIFNMLVESMRRNGIKAYDKIISVTPQFMESVKRGVEIDAWLSTAASNYGGVEDFCIIDDDSDMEPHMDKLFQTQGMSVGLTEDVANRVIVALNK